MTLKIKLPKDRECVVGNARLVSDLGLHRRLPEIWTQPGIALRKSGVQWRAGGQPRIIGNMLGLDPAEIHTQDFQKALI